MIEVALRLVFSPERSSGKERICVRIGLSRAEYARRRQAVLDLMREKEFGAFVFFNSTNIFYLTGFAFIPTERPIALILSADGRKTIFVPRLEEEHAREFDEIDDVQCYPEYPGKTHPMNLLAEILVKMGAAKTTVGADADGYSSPQGYRGPKLSEALSPGKMEVVRDFISELRAIKSPEEIALIRESARWGNLAHALLQEYSLPGRTEDEISMRASMEATIAMLRTLGDSLPRGSSTRTGAHAGFRGQVGPNSALPHAVSINAVLKTGDVLVTGATANVAGYSSELERTMFVGEPNAVQRKFFTLMKQAQEIAFEAIRPGRRCSEVDDAVREFFEKEKLWDYWRHHTGHALGLLGHEAPFFDTGDDTIIRPGMVFSVEPGLYVPGVGGFRHSDTVVVTEDGIDFITYYPRKLDKLICGVK
ncbi:MAG: aminopeptidase P family protein [Firmicutes bacterium]|nr:aminopeptidase P family protein [Candidatus Fermentithermobacillaceae bacterium]